MAYAHAEHISGGADRDGGCAEPRDKRQPGCAGRARARHRDIRWRRHCSCCRGRPHTEDQVPVSTCFDLPCWSSWTVSWICNSPLALNRLRCCQLIAEACKTSAMQHPPPPPPSSCTSYIASRTAGAFLPRTTTGWRMHMQTTLRRPSGTWHARSPRMRLAESR